MRKRVLLFQVFCLFCCHELLSQAPNPRASFSFNERVSVDPINKIVPRIVGAAYCEDRFGNPNNAIHIFGNEFSYINLGNSAVLKPRSGSVSLWAKIEREVFTGKGYVVNPILITKNSKRDDFIEAYGIYYHLETDRLNASCARDSLRQTVVIANGITSLYTWQHLVITYDDDFFCFYINGKLQRKAVKQFETAFLEGDSVLLGISANKKNNRFMEGAIDDLEFFDVVLNEQQVTQLYEAPNPNKNAILLKWLGIVLVSITFLILFYFFIKYEINQRAKKERMLLEVRNLVLETELKVNRALMNPHFVFNSLNTLQNFILKDEKASANKYLVKFSRLLRKIMESNLSGQITLETEINLLREYLDIECLRFEEDISYSIMVDPGINVSLTDIPVMMLQPFVENALWHGLLNKDGEKILSISFLKKDENCVECIIDDNGTGRSTEVKPEARKKSMATSFINQRLALLSRLNNLECTMEIQDKPNKSGTTVRILLPILKTNGSSQGNHH